MASEARQERRLIRGAESLRGEDDRGAVRDHVGAQTEVLRGGVEQFPLGEEHLVRSERASKREGRATTRTVTTRRSFAVSNVQRRNRGVIRGRRAS